MVSTFCSVPSASIPADPDWFHRKSGGSAGLPCHFRHKSHFPCVGEGAADVPVLGSGVERNQPVAVPAVGLKSVADFLRPLPEDLRALRAFDFYFFVNHGMPEGLKGQLSASEFKRSLMASRAERLHKMPTGFVGGLFWL
jgi:hypothetical protein